MKIGGIAKNFFIPETEDELISLVKQLDNNHEKYYLISGGSNILIDDEKTYDNVIYLKKFNTTAEKIGKDTYYFGASCTLNQVIHTMQKEGFSAIEYLYGVPATVGGSAVMNAGSSTVDKCFLKYTKSVRYFDGQEVIEVLAPDIIYAHRKSMFMGKNVIILSVVMQGVPSTAEEIQKEIDKRVAYNRFLYTKGCGTLGSIFSKSNKYIMHLIKLLSVPSSNHSYFSKDCPNMINSPIGKSSYKQVKKCITRVEKIHQLFSFEIHTEIIDWNK